MKKYLIISISLFLMYSSSVYSNKKFEIGIGMAAIGANHYRGSDETRMYYWPLPYIEYKDDIIEAKNAYVRGKIITYKNLSLVLSFNFGLSVDSENNKARSGMPDKDFTLEVGPGLRYKLFETKDQASSFYFSIPFRRVLASDLTYVSGIGSTLQSAFSWTYIGETFKSELSLSALWGNKDFHNYFHGVEPEYATSSREAYESNAGYSGSQFLYIVTKDVDYLKIIGFLRYQNLSNVAFSNGPLFKRNHYFQIGSGIFWML